MDHLKLVLKFRLDGHDHDQVKGAARMKLDGRGGLTFYDVQSGNNERIDLRLLRSFTLHSVGQAAA